MLMLHAEHDVTARPSAHPPRKILARTGWALTLVQLGDAIGHRRSPLTSTPSIMPILLTPLGTALTTRPITTARLDPTPTQRRLRTQTAAITTLRTRRREPTLAPFQQTKTGATPCPWTLTTGVMK